MNKGIITSIFSFLNPNTESETNMKHLKTGDKAPYFEALNERGDTITLDNFKGKKLALFFYPADNTPTCTMEACNLRDHYAELKANGIEVLGVSPDSIKKHQNFINKHTFPFSLIADTDLKMTKDYGLWGHKKFMGREFDGLHRSTFLIDENGIIERAIYEVKSSNHAAQLLETVENQ
jgi:thioredoxin-dependent peroxiredoxin